MSVSAESGAGVEQVIQCEITSTTVEINAVESSSEI
jgi:hypothetical protein